MKKKEAEAEKIKYSNLQNKVLLHKTHKIKMQVVEMGIEEVSPETNHYFVYCKLKGELGDVTETLDYVLQNYSANTHSVK